MSPEEYEKLQQERGQAPEQQDLGLDEPPADRYDQAVAIDPGATAGLAYTDGDHIVTETSEFWVIIEDLTRPAGVLGTIPHEQIVILLEAPYKSAVGKSGHNETAIAYSSGRVAREAELLAERLSRKFEVVEHDPAGQGASWDSTTTERMLGQTWDGPDNEHVRDALRLLVFYNFL
jgi:hypothetical protein